jgi:hypothetical protein
VKRARGIAAAAVVDADFTNNTITLEEWHRMKEAKPPIHIVLTEADRG